MMTTTNRNHDLLLSPEDSLGSPDRCVGTNSLNAAGRARSHEKINSVRPVQDLSDRDEPRFSEQNPFISGAWDDYDKGDTSSWLMVGQESAKWHPECSSVGQALNATSDASSDTTRGEWEDEWYLAKNDLLDDSSISPEGPEFYRVKDVFDDVVPLTLTYAFSGWCHRGVTDLNAQEPFVEVRFYDWPGDRGPRAAYAVTGACVDSLGVEHPVIHITMPGSFTRQDWTWMQKHHYIIAGERKALAVKEAGQDTAYLLTENGVLHQLEGANTSPDPESSARGISKYRVITEDGAATRLGVMKGWCHKKLKNCWPNGNCEYMRCRASFCNAARIMSAEVDIVGVAFDPKGFPHPVLHVVREGLVSDEAWASWVLYDAIIGAGSMGRDSSVGIGKILSTLCTYGASISSLCCVLYFWGDLFNCGMRLGDKFRGRTGIPPHCLSSAYFFLLGFLGVRGIARFLPVAKIPGLCYLQDPAAHFVGFYPRLVTLHRCCPGFDVQKVVIRETGVGMVGHYQTSITDTTDPLLLVATRGHVRVGGDVWLPTLGLTLFAGWISNSLFSGYDGFCYVSVTWAPFIWLLGPWPSAWTTLPFFWCSGLWELTYIQGAMHIQEGGNLTCTEVRAFLKDHPFWRIGGNFGDGVDPAWLSLSYNLRRAKWENVFDALYTGWRIFSPLLIGMITTVLFIWLCNWFVLLLTSLRASYVFARRARMQDKIVFHPYGTTGDHLPPGRFHALLEENGFNVEWAPLASPEEGAADLALLERGSTIENTPKLARFLAQLQKADPTVWRIVPWFVAPDGMHFKRIDLAPITYARRHIKVAGDATFFGDVSNVLCNWSSLSAEKQLFGCYPGALPRLRADGTYVASYPAPAVGRKRVLVTLGSSSNRIDTEGLLAIKLAHPGKTLVTNSMDVRAMDPDFLFEARADHDSWFLEFDTVYCHGGAGTVDTARAAGCNVVSLSNLIDRANYQLSFKTERQPLSIVAWIYSDASLIHLVCAVNRLRVHGSLNASLLLEIGSHWYCSWCKKVLAPGVVLGALWNVQFLRRLVEQRIVEATPTLATALGAPIYFLSTYSNVLQPLDQVIFLFLGFRYLPWLFMKFSSASSMVGILVFGPWAVVLRVLWILTYRVWRCYFLPAMLQAYVALTDGFRIKPGKVYVSFHGGWWVKLCPFLCQAAFITTERRLDFVMTEDGWKVRDRTVIENDWLSRYCLFATGLDASEMDRLKRLMTFRLVKIGDERAEPGLFNSVGQFQYAMILLNLFREGMVTFFTLPIGFFCLAAISVTGFSLLVGLVTLVVTLTLLTFAVARRLQNGSDLMLLMSVIQEADLVQALRLRIKQAETCAVKVIEYWQALLGAPLGELMPSLDAFSPDSEEITSTTRPCFYWRGSEGGDVHERLAELKELVSSYAFFPDARSIDGLPLTDDATLDILLSIDCIGQGRANDGLIPTDHWSNEINTSGGLIECDSQQEMMVQQEEEYEEDVPVLEVLQFAVTGARAVLSSLVTSATQDLRELVVGPNIEDNTDIRNPNDAEFEDVFDHFTAVDPRGQCEPPSVPLDTRDWHPRELHVGLQGFAPEVAGSHGAEQLEDCVLSSPEDKTPLEDWNGGLVVITSSKYHPDVQARFHKVIRELKDLPPNCDWLFVDCGAPAWVVDLVSAVVTNASLRIVTGTGVVVGVLNTPRATCELRVWIEEGSNDNGKLGVRDVLWHPDGTWESLDGKTWEAVRATPGRQRANIKRLYFNGAELVSDSQKFTDFSFLRIIQGPRMDVVTFAREIRRHGTALNLRTEYALGLLPDPPKQLVALKEWLEELARTFDVLGGTSRCKTAWPPVVRTARPRKEARFAVWLHPSPKFEFTPLEQLMRDRIRVANMNKRVSAERLVLDKPVKRNFTYQMDSPDYRQISGIAALDEGMDGQAFACREVMLASLESYTRFRGSHLPDACKRELARIIADNSPGRFYHCDLADPVWAARQYLSKKAYGTSAEWMACGLMTRREIVRQGFATSITALGATPLRTGIYTPALLHAFPKSQIVKRQKLVDNPALVRSITAASGADFIMQAILCAEMNARHHWGSYGKVGMPTSGAIMQEHFGRFEDCDEIVSMDINQFDRCIPSCLLDVVTEVRKIGFEDHPLSATINRHLECAAMNTRYAYIVNLVNLRLEQLRGRLSAKDALAFDSVHPDVWSVIRRTADTIVREDTLCPGGYVLKVTGGNTGDYNVTAVNSTVLAAAMIHCVSKMEGRPYRDFKEYAVLGNLGDDNNVGFKTTKMHRRLDVDRLIEIFWEEFQLRAREEGTGRTIWDQTFLAKHPEPGENFTEDFKRAGLDVPKMAILHDKARLLRSIAQHKLADARHFKHSKVAQKRYQIERLVGLMANTSHYPDIYEGLAAEAHRLKKELRAGHRKGLVKIPSYATVLQKFYDPKRVHEFEHVHYPRIARLSEWRHEALTQIISEDLADTARQATWSHLGEFGEYLKTDADVSPGFFEPHMYYCFAIENGRAPEVAELSNLCRRSAFANFTNAELWMRTTGDFLPSDPDLWQAARAFTTWRMVVYTSVYLWTTGSLEVLNTHVVGRVVLRLIQACRYDLPNLFAAGSHLHFVATGRSSEALSRLMPKDKNYYFKKVALMCARMVDPPLWLCHVPLPALLRFCATFSEKAAGIPYFTPTLTIVTEDLAKGGPWHDTAIAISEYFTTETGAVTVTAPCGTGKTRYLPDAFLSQSTRTVKPWSNVVVVMPRQILCEEYSRRKHVVWKKRGVSDMADHMVCTYGYLAQATLEGQPQWITDDTLVIYDEAHESSAEWEYLIKKGMIGRYNVLLTATPIDWMRRYPHFAVDVDPLHKVTFEAPRMKDIINEFVSRAKECSRILVIIPGIDQGLEVVRQLRLLGHEVHHVSSKTPVVPKTGHVVATAIADASLTIVGCDCVIDSGVSIVNESGKPKRVVYSKCTQIQRAGRTGRTNPGVYVSFEKPVSYQYKSCPSLEHILSESPICSLFPSKAYLLKNDLLVENLRVPGDRYARFMNTPRNHEHAVAAALYLQAAHVGRGDTRREYTAMQRNSEKVARSLVEFGIVSFPSVEQASKAYFETRPYYISSDGRYGGSRLSYENHRVHVLEDKSLAPIMEELIRNNGPTQLVRRGMTSEIAHDEP